jgi:hypothetical protein
VSIIRYQYFNSLSVAVQLNLTSFQDSIDIFLSLVLYFLDSLIKLSLCRRILNLVDGSLIDESLCTRDQSPIVKDLKSTEIHINFILSAFFSLFDCHFIDYLHQEKWMGISGQDLIVFTNLWKSIISIGLRFFFDFKANACLLGHRQIPLLLIFTVRLIIFFG